MGVLSAKHVSKSYPDTGQTALNDVSFDVGKDEIFGLIGPDGAGKTSLFRILATVILPDEGEVSIFGHDIIKEYTSIRRFIGYMPGRFSLYTDLTVEENLQFFATLYGVTVEENYSIIRDIYVQLEPFKSRRAGKLSGGMKQKLALCCALIHHPRVLLLDEPTTGVDPVSRKEFWDILDVLRSKGMTILVSTPYMDEAERCDRIALIQEGAILSIDTPLGITQKYPYQLFGVQSADIRRALGLIRKSEYIDTCYSFGDSLHITFPNDEPQVERILRELSVAGVTETSIAPIDPHIEDCFIQLMNRHGSITHH
ncbi:MAG TPA: ABC transporter ATP-binding protein [Membranihabitans sp.]|nr:ABC transporter ATP-binding protein [Membranihabitans sp.]